MKVLGEPGPSQRFQGGGPVLPSPAPRGRPPIPWRETPFSTFKASSKAPSSSHVKGLCCPLGVSLPLATTPVIALGHPGHLGLSLYQGRLIGDLNPIGHRMSPLSCDMARSQARGRGLCSASTPITWEAKKGESLVGDEAQIVAC